MNPVLKFGWDSDDGGIFTPPNEAPLTTAEFNVMGQLQSAAGARERVEDP